MNLQAVGCLLWECLPECHNPLAAPAGGHGCVQEPSPRMLGLSESTCSSILSVLLAKKKTASDSTKVLSTLARIVKVTWLSFQQIILCKSERRGVDCLPHYFGQGLRKADEDICAQQPVFWCCFFRLLLAEVLCKSSLSRL